MPIRAHCPACRAEFHLQEDSAGTKVRCGTCLDVFEVPLDAPPVPMDAPAVPMATRSREPEPPLARRTRRDEDDYDYERPSLNRRRYRDRRPDNSGRTILIVLGLVFGIKFALIALGVVLALVFMALAPAPAPPPAQVAPWGNGPVVVNDPGPWQPMQPVAPPPVVNRPGWQPAPRPIAPRAPVGQMGPKGFR